MLVGKFVPILNSLADVKLVLKSFSPKKVSLCERERERGFSRMEHSNCMKNRKRLWNKMAPI